MPILEGAQRLGVIRFDFPPVDTGTSLGLLRRVTLQGDAGPAGDVTGPVQLDERPQQRAEHHESIGNPGNRRTLFDADPAQRHDRGSHDL